MCWQKGFLLITLVTLSSQIPEWSLCQRKEKCGKSQHDWRLSFQISCPLYSPIRIYLRPHQKMLLNIFYQSWQRQTMLCNNSCQSLGCVYADLYSGYCSRTVLVCWHSVLKSCVALTCCSYRLAGLCIYILWGRNNRNKSHTTKGIFC